MVKIKLSYLKNWDVYNLYGWVMSQKLPVVGLKWVEDTSQFKKGFIEKYKEDTDEDYLFEVDIKCPENYMKFIMIYPFLLKK